MIDLKPHDKELIEKILADFLPGKTVWAYGSRVKGLSHEGSDIDLVVRDAVTLETLYRVKDAFSESHLPFFVDISDWDSLPEAYKTEIEKQYEVIQK